MVLEKITENLYSFIAPEHTRVGYDIDENNKKVIAYIDPPGGPFLGVGGRSLINIITKITEISPGKFLLDVKKEEP